MIKRIATRSSSIALIIAVLVACGEEIVQPPPSPDRPADLRVTLVSARSARLEWSAVMSTDGITYSVYRNDAKIAEVEATQYVDSALASNNAYTWFVSAKNSAGGISAPSDPVTLTFSDIDPPTVTTSSPANNATGQSRIPFVAVTFNEPMIPSSLTSAITARVTSTGEAIYGTINYNSSTRSADFRPLWILPAQASITVTIGTGARDLAGNALATPYSVSFVTGSTPATPADLPASTEQLLISGGISETNASREIFKLSTDGTRRINLTNHPARDTDGSWSPDGRHIAFTSDRDGTFDIFIMREDGTGLRQLTTGDDTQVRPTWTPDGRRIVFVSTKDGVAPPGFNTPTDIWIMNADGTNQINLTKTASLWEGAAHVSPGGGQLLYRSEGVIGGGQLSVANIDGSASRSLHAPIPDHFDDVGAWSPDGTQIVFSAYKATPDPFSQTYVLLSVNPDGSNLRNITTGGARRSPAWSPDGRALVFSLSGFDEFWGRFGKIGTQTLDLTTGMFRTLTPQTPASEVMSPQAWRR